MAPLEISANKQHAHLTEHRPALLVAALFFLLAAIYSIITPIFESPDELWHYPFVWHMANTGTLPVQDPANPQLWHQEGSQPPLYYALAALLTFPFPGNNLPELIYPNPHADIGLVSADGNANIVVHTEREAWPWRGAVLAIHLARLFSVMLGTATVITVYAISLALWPTNHTFALTAMVFVAFNPMFLFISGAVNNDNLVILLASLVLWQLVTLVAAYARRSTDPPLRHAVSLGLLAGLAALTKVSGLGLVGLTGLTLLVWGIRRRSWRVTLLYNALVGIIAAAVAGWWYWRNVTLYGDWSGTENMIAMMGARPIAPTWPQLASEIPGLFRSFWGLFGYFSVPMPDLIYWLLNLLLVIGAVGWLLILLQKTRGEKIPPGLWQTWPILLGWIAIMLVGFVQWTIRTPATQGRLIFPTLAAVAPLWATGWLTLFPRGQWLLPGIPLFLLACAVPWTVIAPAYARPAPIVQPPPSTQPLDATFGNVATLTGYHLPQATIHPGNSLPITLYWRGEQPTPIDYSVFLHLVDEYGLIVAQRDVYHGPGVYPTSQWATGTQFGDTYALRLPTTSSAPTMAHLTVGLYNHSTGERLPVAGGDNLSFGQIQIEANSGQHPNPQQLHFAGGITLAGYALDLRRQLSPGDTVTLTLYWQAQDKPSQNYKVFAHIVGDNEIRAGQHDSNPQSGAAPTASWTPDQIIIDEHPITIAPDAPPGAYKIIVGLYDEETGRRLSLIKDGEAWVQADSVTLGGVRVVGQ